MKEEEIKSLQGSDMSGSMNALEKEIGEFRIKLVELQKMNDELEKQKKINQTLVEGIEGGQDAIVGEIGTDTLQYCKKVKYLDKVWILVVKQHEYFWIDQEKIPMDDLSKIPGVEVEDNTAKLTEKLIDLEHQKNQLV